MSWARSGKVVGKVILSGTSEREIAQQKPLLEGNVKLAVQAAQGAQQAGKGKGAPPLCTIPSIKARANTTDVVLRQGCECRRLTYGRLLTRAL